MNRRRPNEKLEMLLLQYYIFSLGLNRWKPFIFQWIFQPVTIITQSPIGVAAQPSPSTLAIIFAAIYSLTLWFSGILGKRNLSNGESPCVSVSKSPERLATSISPVHKAIMPSIVIASETASPALSIAALLRASTSPLIIPKLNPISIINPQSLLSIKNLQYKIKSF